VSRLYNRLCNHIPFSAPALPGVPCPVPLGSTERRHPTRGRRVGELIGWDTHTGNMADKIRHGTTNRGERCGSAKLTEKDVLEIRKLKGQYSHRELGEMFSVSRQHIDDILSYRRWLYIESEIAILKGKDLFS
jgi:hypothetical protein